MGIAIARPSTSGGSIPSFDKALHNNRPRSSLGFETSNSRSLENKQVHQRATRSLDLKRSNAALTNQLSMATKPINKVRKVSGGPNVKSSKPKGIGQYTRLPALNRGPKFFAEILHSTTRTRYWPKDRKITQMFVWSLTQRLLQIGKGAPLSPQKAWVHTILAQYRARLLGDPFNLRNTHRYAKPPILKPRIVNSTNARLRDLLVQATGMISSFDSDNHEALATLRGHSKGDVHALETSTDKVAHDSHREFMTQVSGIYELHVEKTRQFIYRLLNNSANIDQQLVAWKANIPKGWSQ